MEDFTPVTNSVISYNRYSLYGRFYASFLPVGIIYMEDFTPVINGVISPSR